MSEASGHTVPGEPCPACQRRVPFPVTEKTPPVKRMGYWLPADEFDAHADVLETAAQYLGTYERPFWQFQTVLVGLVALMQEESLRGYAHRRPEAA